MRNKGIFLFFMLICITVATKMDIWASDPSADVELELITDQYMNSKDDLITYNITFRNRSIINNNLFFSYHVFNSKGELVKYDNELIQLYFDDDGKSTVSFLVDFDQEELNCEKELLIAPDIYDSENNQWYSADTGINFVYENVLFQNSFRNKVYHCIYYVTHYQLGLFITNLFILVLVGICTIIIIKKAEF